MVSSSQSYKTLKDPSVQRKQKRLKPVLNPEVSQQEVSTKKAKKDALVKHRDFTADLDKYLDDWMNSVNDQSDSSTWKFNKVLQEWALKNWQSKTLVPMALFKKVLPYFDSIRGSARDRLLEIAERISTAEITEQQQQTENTDEAPQQKKEVITKLVQSRANKIITLLSSGQ